MRSPIRAFLLVAVAAFVVSCGFNPHPKSGTVACNPGGANCCPEGYICVGRGASTATGSAYGTCWNKGDLPPAALAASYDYTPANPGDPACLVTAWLPPPAGVDGGEVAGPAGDAGGMNLDERDTNGEGDSGGDAPLLQDTAADLPVDPGSGSSDGRDVRAGDQSIVDGGDAARDVAAELPVVVVDGGSDDGPEGQDGGGTDGGPSVARRLPLPCTAPLPTGFCMASEKGDWIGAGKNYAGSGDVAVSLWTSGSNAISFQLAGTTWDAEFAAPGGGRLMPGLFSPAQRYPFQVGTAAGLDIGGDGRGCNTLNGRFSVEEMQWAPGQGLVRFSVIFEQRCEGYTSALRGMINFHASGNTDPKPTPDRLINLAGKVFRVAYDPAANLAYGLDAANSKLAKIDLASGNVTWANVAHVPNAACIDAKRGRLFVVNTGTLLITEYSTADLTAVRDIAWTGQRVSATDSQFAIHCAPNKLYLVDGVGRPGLFTVEGLDDGSARQPDGGLGGALDGGLGGGFDGGVGGGLDGGLAAGGPYVIEHTAAVPGVGGLALNSAATSIYYWYRGDLTYTDVRRFDTANLTKLDQSATNLPSFEVYPIDSPLLLDETRGLVFAKNYVFDAANLSKVLFTLPSSYDLLNGAAENAYALDTAHGLLATKNFVYGLDQYGVVAAALDPDAVQLFFDNSGVLWFLSTTDGALKAQIIKH